MGIVPALALVTCIVFFVIPGDPPIREGRAPEPNLTTSFGLHGFGLPAVRPVRVNAGALGTLGRSLVDLLYAWVDPRVPIASAPGT